MQPGWHVLLDSLLSHCREVFQHKDLAAVEGLEAALQQQMKSRVGAITHCFMCPDILPLCL